MSKRSNNQKGSSAQPKNNSHRGLMIGGIVGLIIILGSVSTLLCINAIEQDRLKKQQAAQQQELERRESSGTIQFDNAKPSSQNYFGQYLAASTDYDIKPNCVITNKNIKVDLHPELETSPEIDTVFSYGTEEYLQYGFTQCNSVITGSYNTEAEDTTLYIVSSQDKSSSGFKLENLADNKFRITTSFNVLANGVRFPGSKEITLGLKNNRTGSDNVIQSLEVYVDYSEEDKQFLDSWKSKIDNFKKAEQERKKREEELKKEQELRSSPPKVGMTQDEVRRSAWGSPKSVNNYSYEWGSGAAWWYGGSKFVYFINGKVSMVSY